MQDSSNFKIFSTAGVWDSTSSRSNSESFPLYSNSGYVRRDFIHSFGSPVQIAFRDPDFLACGLRTGRDDRVHQCARGRVPSRPTTYE